MAGTFDPNGMPDASGYALKPDADTPQVRELRRHKAQLQAELNDAIKARDAAEIRRLREEIEDLTKDLETFK